MLNVAKLTTLGVNTERAPRRIWRDNGVILCWEKYNNIIMYTLF